MFASGDRVFVVIKVYDSDSMFSIPNSRKFAAGFLPAEVVAVQEATSAEFDSVVKVKLLETVGEQFIVEAPYTSRHVVSDCFVFAPAPTEQQLQEAAPMLKAPHSYIHGCNRPARALPTQQEKQEAPAMLRASTTKRPRDS